MNKIKHTKSNNFDDNIGWLHNQRRHLISVVGLLSIVILLLGVASSFALNRFEKAEEEEERAAVSFWTIVDHTRKAEIHFLIQVHEWKNILIRGHKSKDYTTYFTAFNKQAQYVNQNLQAIEETAGDIDLDANMVTAVLQQHNDLSNRYLEALKTFNPDNPMSFRQVDQLVHGIDRPFNQSFAKLNTRTVELAERKRSDGHIRLMEQSHAIKFVISISAVISIVLAGFTLFLALRIVSVR